jgi:hypothetical protein
MLMRMAQSFVIVFAGVPGSSKSIVAYYLSETYSLPIFSTDNIRFEVKEDFLVGSINEPRALKEFERRQAKRFSNLITQQKDFIRDGSVDRHWDDIKKQLKSANYKWCLIDMELSRDFLLTLYHETGRLQAIKELDGYLKQHESFMEAYESDVYIKITDATFKDRNKVAKEALSKFLEE